MRIVHTADNHLDAPLSSLPPDICTKRKADRRASFSKIIDYTIQSKADCLVISGDLSDSSELSGSLLSFLNSEFARMGKIPVFIATGNHDYSLKDKHFPGNVHVFSDKPETFTVAEGTITGISFSSQITAFESIIPRANGAPSVLCLHGDILSKSEYNPLNKDIISSLGYSYIALGHVHNFYRDNQIVYPGCHDGAGFDETGEKGFVCATIDKYTQNVSFIPSSSAIYKTIKLDVSDFSSSHEIASHLENEVSDCICKIILTGTTIDIFTIDTTYISSILSQKAKFVKITDETWSTDVLNSRILSEFSQIITRENEKVSALALKYAISAMKGVDFEL